VPRSDGGAPGAGESIGARESERGGKKVSTRKGEGGEGKGILWSGGKASSYEELKNEGRKGGSKGGREMGGEGGEAVGVVVGGVGGDGGWRWRRKMGGEGGKGGR